MITELKGLIQQKAILSKEQLAEALSCFQPLTVKKNKLLLTQGTVADKLFFIVKGCLRLYYYNEDRSIFTSFMAFENTFLTSIVSFISREPAPEYIQAVEDSELLVISYDRFTLLRNITPEWDKIYRHILEYG